MENYKCHFGLFFKILVIFLNFGHFFSKFYSFFLNFGHFFQNFQNKMVNYTWLYDDDGWRKWLWWRNWRYHHWWWWLSSMSILINIINFLLNYLIYFIWMMIKNFPTQYFREKWTTLASYNASVSSYRKKKRNSLIRLQWKPLPIHKCLLSNSHTHSTCMGFYRLAEFCELFFGKNILLPMLYLYS